MQRETQRMHKDEKEKLTVDYTTYEDIEDALMAGEIELALCKARWDRQENGYKEKDEQEKKEDKERFMERAEEEAVQREIFDLKNKRVDFTKQRATDMKLNRRTHLAEERPTAEEFELQARKDIYERVIKEFKNKNCNRKGN